MKMKKLLPLLLLILCLAACRREASDVPKRYAFPRVELYDTATVIARTGGLSFEINAAADTAAPQPGWLDVTYPRYGATLHISVNSFTDDEQFAAAIENRELRIHLNFGDKTAKAETFVNSAGFECTIIGNPDAGSAPILFLAADRQRQMLSGSAVFAGSTQPVDSISPIYNALYSDITNLLLSLR